MNIIIVIIIIIIIFMIIRVEAHSKFLLCLLPPTVLMPYSSFFAREAFNCDFRTPPP